MKQKTSNKRPAPEINAGKYLKRVREKASLTKLALGKLIRMHGTDLSKYELNRTKMTLNTFLEICRAAGVTDFNEIFKEEIKINKTYPWESPSHAVEEIEKIEKQSKQKISADIESIITAMKKAQNTERPDSTIGVDVNQHEDQVNPKKAKSSRKKVLKFT